MVRYRRMYRLRANILRARLRDRCFCAVRRFAHHGWTLRRAVNTYVAFCATTGVVFGAAYMLVLYRKVIFGEQKNKDAAEMADLTRTEYGYLVPLAVMVIIFGVAPGLVMSNISPTVAALIQQYQTTKDGIENFANIPMKTSASQAAVSEARHD